MLVSKMPLYVGVVVMCVLFQASAYADTVHVSNTSELLDATSNAFDVIVISDGIYKDSGKITLDKPITIMSSTGDYRNSDAVFTGNVNFEIQSGNVIISGLKFNNTTTGDDVYGHITTDNTSTYNDITIKNNYFNYTEQSGLHLRGNFDYIPTNYLIKNNNFTKIGHNGGDSSASAIYMEFIDDSLVSENYINDTMNSGMEIAFSLNNTVTHNVIKNTSKNGIHIKSYDAANTVLSYNTITYTNTVSTILHNDGTVSPDPIARAGIFVEDTWRVTIHDNTITDNNSHGVLVCSGLCDQKYLTPIPKVDSDSYILSNSTAVLYNNKIHDNNGIGLVNASPVMLFAMYNYWSGGEPSTLLQSDSKYPLDDTHDTPIADIYGKVSYKPYFIDEKMTRHSNDDTVQKNISEFTKGRHCQINILDPEINFASNTLGNTSVSQHQTIINTGSSEVTGITITADDWYLDDSTIPGSITEVNVSDKFAKLDKPYYLPISIVSGSMDKIEFRVNLQIDHAGISTGHATQVISYTATCQK